MSERLTDLVCSVDLQPTLKKIEQDRALGFAEYSLLRDSADAKFYQLMASVRSRQGIDDEAALDGEHQLRQLQDASVRMAQLLQTSCLALRRLQLEYPEQRLAREALAHQLAYMQACLRRSMDSFETF